MQIIESSRELIGAIRERVNDSEKPAALVFNCHITGLAVARSLGRRGVPVVGLDKDSSGYGLHSRYTTVAGRCPYPLDDERAFVDLLMEIGAALNKKAVLFPCLDEWVFAVARHSEHLENHFILPFSDLDTVERILDKNLLYKKCLERGIPIPKTFYIGEESPEQIASKIQFPCIVKPALQREFTNQFGQKVFRVETREDLLETCERASAHSLLAQELVGSSIDSFYSLCSYVGMDGRPKGVFVGRKLEQYPPDFGTACLVDSPYVDAIVERGLDILNQFGYRGISEVEFIYDERDRDFKLLDINTRVWKWIGLPIHAGIDLPWLAYYDSIHGDVQASEVPQQNLRWVYLKDYVALRRIRSGPTEATLSKQDWLNLIGGDQSRDGGIVCAVLARDDPEPFVRMIESLFEQGQYYCAC